MLSYTSSLRYTSHEQQGNKLTVTYSTPHLVAISKGAYEYDKKYWKAVEVITIKKIKYEPWPIDVSHEDWIANDLPNEHPLPATGSDDEERTSTDDTSESEDPIAEELGTTDSE